MDQRDVVIGGEPWKVKGRFTGVPSTGDPSGQSVYLLTFSNDRGEEHSISSERALGDLSIDDFVELLEEARRNG